LTEANSRPGWHKIAKAIVLLAFCTLCAWWAILISGPERYWFSGVFLYLPYWIVLVPLVITTGIAWPLGWRWRGIAFATALIFLWPVMGFSVGHSDSGSGRIRLMTYNIKAYLNFHEIGGFDDAISEIQRYDPDIVVMQDAEMLRATDTSDSSLVRRVAGSRAVYVFGQYVVASRLPVRDCNVGSIAYSEQPHTYVHCIVMAHGQEVDLYTAHFLSPRNGLNALRGSGIKAYGDWQASVEARMLQAAKLAQALANHPRPAIVAGDLNAPEQSMIVRTLLDTGLRDAFSSAGWGYGYTHGHSLRPHISTIRIDHILVSPEIGVADCFVGGEKGSEHRPVIADLWIY
jgi:endonuclease/exonuclease/phosphatase (EEP) superfamily protein YafD